MTKSINEILEQIRKQVDENVKECDERIANNEAIQEAHDNIVGDGGRERIPFYSDENSETLNPKWIDDAVDIAANLNLEGFDNAIYEDAFKNGMRHVLGMLEKEAL
jgi:predicted Holliday junction resolvase-like endonuclease